MITKHYAYSAIVSTKPISGKKSYTIHYSPEDADRQARSSLEARKRWHHTRLLYRVNVYLKHFH